MGSFSLLSAAARRLDGKVALITGGASGIGECTAKLFCRHGAKVVIADIQDELGAALCHEIGSDFISFVHCDVSDESQVQAAIDFVVSVYGKLDIMYNNAGIGDKLGFKILDTDVSRFERVVSVNLKGSFLGLKHAARVMIPLQTGSIILTASTASVVGGHSGYAYTSSKHAVIGLAKESAVELGKHGIRVNCVSPFIVATPMTRNGFSAVRDEEVEDVAAAFTNLKGVVLKVDDVANAALFLASDDSKYVSGHNLLVDGGYSVSSHLELPVEPKC